MKKPRSAGRRPRPAAPDPRLPGVFPAVVTDVMDPLGLGRVQVRLRRGVTVTLDDQTGQESVTIATPGGQRIVLTDGPASVRIVDANGNSVDLAATGITIAAATKVTINASEVDVSAGLVQCNAGMAKFSGVVQCSTLVANSVVSASYTPGTGNVM